MSRGGEYPDETEAITDVVTLLESIDVALGRIADVMELDREDRKAREAAESAGDKFRAEQEARELVEAETRYPGITADVARVAYYPPF